MKCKNCGCNVEENTFGFWEHNTMYHAGIVSEKKPNGYRCRCTHAEPEISYEEASQGEQDGEKR